MFKLSISTSLCVAFGTLIASTPAQADEPLFGYVYTTDIAPAGKTELEQWSTFREGRSQGSYHLWQGRTEITHGLTDNLQISGYINLAHANVNGNAPDGTTSPPEVFADYAVDPDRRFKKFRFESISGEAIWRISSPYTKPIGLALYLEPSIGPRTYELESRLIAQKNFIDDRLVFAANVTYAIELRHLPGEFGSLPGTPEAEQVWDHETDVNIGVAGSYRFMPKVAAGFELLNEREWAGLNAFKSSKSTNVAYYLGPNIHYGGQHIFVTASLLWQLKRAEDHDNPPPGFIVNGISNADDFEKVRLRIKVGYNF
jgi:hypothetical protein